MYVDGFMVLWLCSFMLLWFYGFMVLWVVVLWLHGVMVVWFQKIPNFHVMFSGGFWSHIQDYRDFIYRMFIIVGARLFDI